MSAIEWNPGSSTARPPSFGHCGFRPKFVVRAVYVLGPLHYKSYLRARNRRPAAHNGSSASQNSGTYRCGGVGATQVAWFPGWSRKPKVAKTYLGQHVAGKERYLLLVSESPPVRILSVLIFRIDSGNSPSSRLRSYETESIGGLFYG